MSTKGAAGGYELAMQPTEISLLSIIEAVDNVFDVKSHLEIGGLDADSVEAVERTLAEIAASARSILSSTTLTSLLAAKAA